MNISSLNINIDFFNSKIDKSKGNLNCWNWTGSFHNQGYGTFKINKKNYLAHRISFYLMYVELINSKPFVCHSCDNRKCVNPIHLFSGTAKDNNQDCKKKGRTLRGSKATFTKLKKEDVIEIRKLISSGEKYKKIALKFNISESNICSIKIRRAWDWL